MTEVPAKRTESEVPALPTNDAFGVFSEIDQETIAIYRPQYKGDKDKELKKGLITMNGEDQAETINAVLLRIANRGNMKWPEVFDIDTKEPECFSDAQGQGPIGGTSPETFDTCAECGKANFDMWWNKYKKKSPCARVIEGLWFDLERERLFLWNYSRKNLQLVFRKLQPLYREKVKDLDQSKQATWQYAITLGVEEDGMAYRPTFDLGEKLKKDMVVEMEQLHNIFAPSFLSRTQYQPGEVAPKGDEVKTAKKTQSDSDLPF